MSTIEDFENAPIGATASSAETNARYVKSPDRWLLFDGRGDWRVDEYDLESEGFALNPATPTTAREALDLAWELAHPVKVGQAVPAGTEIISVRSEIERAYGTTLVDQVADGFDELHTRTLDPLPDPEPDWLDAPAVMARLEGWISCADPQVFSRENKTGTQWLHATKVYRWDELIDVVPLYPKEDQ